MRWKPVRANKEGGSKKALFRASMQESFFHGHCRKRSEVDLYAISIKSTFFPSLKVLIKRLP
jgi:hypothetical protein